MSVDNFYLKFRFEPFNNFLQLLCIVHISFYASLEREGGGAHFAESVIQFVTQTNFQLLQNIEF